MPTLKKLRILSIILLFTGQIFAQEIRVNQLGYFTNQPKLAVIPADYEGKYQLINDASGEVVFVAMLPESGYYIYANEYVRLIDFSEFSQTGTYHLRIDGTAARSYSFRIGGSLYHNLQKDAIRYYYLNRVSMPILKKYAGIYAREAGHPDTAVLIHYSAASPERPEGTTIATPRGWYDAGDYNKYITDAGIVNFTLSSMVERFPEYSLNLNLNIPESNDPVPDIMDEAIYNLRWMLSMQDPNDGGVYHKCTHLNFAPWVIPAEAASIPRYVVRKSTAAALNLAGVGAQASRILRKYEAEYPGFADSCLAAAEYAYAWALADPENYYIQPGNITTGKYEDFNVEDEFSWAAVELYIATGNEDYLQQSNYLKVIPDIPSRRDMYYPGLISLLRAENELSPLVDIDSVKAIVIDFADRFYYNYETSAYRMPLDTFYWASNSVVANGAIMSLEAYYLTANEKYRELALACMDYLLGRNPTGYSFVSGYGSKTPLYPHDRKSSADTVEAPIPGLLAAGPNPNNTYDCNPVFYPSLEPARCYVDDECSYSTNEISINWNVTLAYLSCALQWLQSPQLLQASTSKQNANMIEAQFDVDLGEGLNAGDFICVRNQYDSIKIINAQTTANSSINFELEHAILNTDSNISISYTPGELQSVYGVFVDSIINHPVLNRVNGSPIIILDARTAVDKPSVKINFSDTVKGFRQLNNELVLFRNSEVLQLETYEPCNEDSTQWELTFNKSIAYNDTLWVSYQGNKLHNSSGALVETKDSLFVLNLLPSPPLLEEIELSPGGDSLLLFFSKALKTASALPNDFMLVFNQNDTLTFSEAEITGELPHRVKLVFTSPIDPADEGLNLFYTGTKLMSELNAQVEIFGPLSIENTSRSPIAVPGIIYANNYYQNVGFQFLECTSCVGDEYLTGAEVGDYANYFIDVSEGGIYTISYRISSVVNNARLLLKFPTDNPIDTLKIRVTDNVEDWITMYSLVTLPAARNLLQLECIGPYFNIDYIKFEQGNTIPLALKKNLTTASIYIYPNPASLNDEVVISLPDGVSANQLQVQLYDMSGRMLSNLRSSPNEKGLFLVRFKDMDTYPEPGLYLIKILLKHQQEAILLNIEE